MALKRATFKQFQMIESDENKENFREANRASRNAVGIAKEYNMNISMQMVISFCRDTSIPTII